MTVGDEFKRQIEHQARGWWASLGKELESVAADSKGEPVETVIPKVQAAVDQSPFEVDEAEVRKLAEAMSSTGKVELKPIEF